MQHKIAKKDYQHLFIIKHKSYMQYMFSFTEDEIRRSVILMSENKVVLRGWVYKKREHKKIIFFDVRTKDGINQCVLHKDKVPEDLWNTALKITQESSIIIEGKKVEFIPLWKWLYRVPFINPNVL